MNPKIVPLRRGQDPSPDLWTPEPVSQGGALSETEGGEQVWNLVGVALRRWPIIAAVAVLVLTLSYGGAALSPRMYQATTSVLITPGREQVLTDQELVTQASGSEASIESEVQVMRSPSVMSRVVDALKLDESPAYNGTRVERSPLDRVLSMVGVSNAPTESRFSVADLSEAERDDLRRRIAARLSREVRVSRRPRTTVVEVSATASSGVDAAAIANATARAYMDEQTQSQFEAAERARDWLRQQVDELAIDVQAKEQAAERFRVEASLPALSDGESGQSAGVQTMLAQARSDLTEREARLRQVERLIAEGGSADLIAGAANSALIAQLRSQESEMQRRQAELEERYGPRNPDVVSGRMELDNLRGRISTEIGRIASGLRNEVEVARRRLAALQQDFGSETLTLNADNSDLFRYRQLLREAEAARGVHQSLVLRLQEVQSQTALPVTNARVMTEASPPGRPSSPDLGSALQTAIMLALALGLGAGFLVEFLDRTVTSAQDAERKTGQRAVLAAPRLGARRYRTLAPADRHPAGYLVEKPMSDFAESLRVLRTSLQRARIDKPTQVIAVTSALAGEGKTTVALCLARIAAMAGQRVALLDCDMRRQNLADVLDLQRTTGLLEVLTEDRPWAEAFQSDAETSLQILGGSPAAFTPLDVFSSRAMSELLTELRGAYDMVVLDCAPVLHVADTRIACALADLTVVVMRAQKTPVSATRSALRELSDAGADIHGVAVNCVPASASKFDYYGAIRYGEQNYYVS